MVRCVLLGEFILKLQLVEAYLSCMQLRSNSPYKEANLCKC